MSAKYTRIPLSSSAAHAESELVALESGSTMSKANEENGSFHIKILVKEQHHDVKGITASMTVAQLKLAVEVVTQIPPSQQRLIFAGKPLRPDDKLLSTFNISRSSTIHLFPIPVAVPAPANQSQTGVFASILNPLQPNTQPGAVQATNVHPTGGRGMGMDPVSHLPIHFDPVISQHAREIRLWSYILVFLSSITLVNNISFMLSSGFTGFTALDVIVNLIDTGCSMGGLYVGFLGLKSTRDVDLNEIKVYVKYLCILAICCIVFRILWVFDIVFDVQAAVRQARRDSSNGDNSSGGGSGSGDNGGATTNIPDPNGPPSQNHALDGKVVQTFAIQASLICLLCVLAWVNCVVRAMRLRAAVQTYNEAMTV